MPSKQTRSKAVPAPERPDVEQHEVVGICNLVLTHADTPLSPAARQALLKAQHTARMQCLVESDGHAFNISALPVVTFVDDIAQFTASARSSEASS